MAVNLVPTFGTCVYCTTSEGKIGIPFDSCWFSSVESVDVVDDVIEDGLV